MNTIGESSLSNAAVAPLDAARLRLTQSLGRRVDSRDPAVRQQAASRLSSELFFKPLLAEMRKFPFGRELTSGGWAGSAFDDRFDERIADAVATGSGRLVNRIAQELDPAGGRVQRAAGSPAPGADQASWPLQGFLTGEISAERGAQQ